MSWRETRREISRNKAGGNDANVNPQGTGTGSSSSPHADWRNRRVESLMPNSLYNTRSDLEAAWLREAAECGDLERLKTVHASYLGNIDAATRVSTTTCCE